MISSSRQLSPLCTLLPYFFFVSSDAHLWVPTTYGRSRRPSRSVLEEFEEASMMRLEKEYEKEELSKCTGKDVLRYAVPEAQDTSYCVWLEHPTKGRILRRPNHTMELHQWHSLHKQYQHASILDDGSLDRTIADTASDIAAAEVHAILGMAGNMWARPTYRRKNKRFLPPKPEKKIVEKSKILPRLQYSCNGNTPYQAYAPVTPYDKEKPASTARGKVAK